MSAVEEIRSANDQFASEFDKGELPMPPGRSLAVVTCMDARLDPARFLGLDLGDAHVIRNAGGLVTEDALRSLAISHWELGTQEAYVIGHTSCGMATFTNETLHRKHGIPTAINVGDYLIGLGYRLVSREAKSIVRSPPSTSYRTTSPIK